MDAIFWDHTRGFVLVQILNAVELATGAEFIGIPHAKIRWNPAKLSVTGARVVWPKSAALILTPGREMHSLRVPGPGGYTAINLKLG